MSIIKVGDKVRFLDSVGGGIVKRFTDKNLVMVEDEDGFEIPTLVSQCVVVTDEEDARQSGRSHKAKVQPVPQPSTPSFKDLGKIGLGRHNEVTIQPASAKRVIDEHTHIDLNRPTAVTERKDGDVLQISLAFIPENDRKIQESNFFCYLVNDSNYWVFFTLLCPKENSKEDVICYFTGLIDPNTKQILFTIAASQVEQLENCSVQLIAFKRDKAFNMQSPMHIDLHINSNRFFKLHAFVENVYFTEHALIQQVVRNGRPYLPMRLNEEEISRNIREKVAQRVSSPTNKKNTSQKQKTSTLPAIEKNDIVEVDLHINQLLDNTNGMSNGEMLQYQLSVFHKTMDAYKTKRGQKIVFIHGKGDVVLRKTIIENLKKQYGNCLWQDASFREYGFGATMVTIRNNK